MKITWHILLSYDVDSSLYSSLTNERLDFSKIIAEENKGFRTAFLMLLIDAGAYDLDSSVASTMQFKIDLEEGTDPNEYFGNIFNVSFIDNNFDYMMMAARIEHAKFKSNDVNDDHIKNFGIDHRSALRLLSIVKK